MDRVFCVITGVDLGAARVGVHCRWFWGMANGVSPLASFDWAGFAWMTMIMIMITMTMMMTEEVEDGVGC